EKVEPFPLLLDALKDRFHLPWHAHVERHDDRSFELAGQRLNILLRLVIEISDGHFGAECTECLGAAPSDRLLIGNADDETLLALEQWCFSNGNHFAILWCTGGWTLRAESSASVCRAIISSLM